MTKAESSGADASGNRSQQRKEKQRIRQRKEKMKPPTKIIVRHLPPTMTEEEFLKQIELPEHEAFYYAIPDWSLGNCASSRAYLTLKQYDDVFLFRDRFDGYVFVDSKGAEYAAIVEFAPFQGLLKNRSRRNDNKANTIEDEPHYQQFLATLQEEREAVAKGSDIKLEFSLDRKKEEITSTPLLQYLAMKKEKRREEAKKRTEEKRRQREEEKERRRQQQQQQQQPQVTKIMSGQGSKANNSGMGANNKVKDGNTAGTERKNSRARRKAEREQRRKEQREKALAKTDEKPENTEATAAADEKPNRESKKYSEKRERDRERNRNRREKEKEKQKPEPSSASTAAAGVASAEETKPKQKSKDEQISDTVLNFIRSVANVKEFVPKHKQKELGEQEIVNSGKNGAVEIKKSSSNDSTNSDVRANFEKEKSKENQEKKDGIFKEPAPYSKKEESERHRREERRIRNKDRPSIAIYQPKPRQRVSDETDPNTVSNKDGRSNPNSDCESVKKDDSKSRKKKVSRYSERRVASFSKSKQNDLPEGVVKLLKKSPSLEDAPSKSDAMHEKTITKDDLKEPINKEIAGNQET